MQDLIKYTRLSEDTVCAGGYKGEVPALLEVPSSIRHAGKAYTVCGVGDSAFSGSANLKRVALPPSLQHIGKKAFAGCEQLAEVAFADAALKVVDDYAFAWCALERIRLEALTERLGAYAFVGCSLLKEVVCTATTPPAISDKTFDTLTLERGMLLVPGNSVEAYKGAEGWKDFCHTASLEEEMNARALLHGGDDDDDDDRPANEPDDIIVTDTIAFRILDDKECCVEQVNPEAKGALQVPNTVAKDGKTYAVSCINKGAFAGCKGLERLALPESMEELHPRALPSADGLTAIEVDPRNQHLSAKDGVLFDKHKNILIGYPKAKPGSHYRVPASVAGIAAGAFAGNPSLEEVYLYEGLRFVGIESFAHCQKLRTLSLPISATDLGNSAFAGCDSLSTIFVMGADPIPLDDAFDQETMARATVYVGRESLPLFKEADGWKLFGKIRPLKDTGHENGPFVFRPNSERCATLVYASREAKGALAVPATVSLGSETYTVDRIGQRSFKDCEGVTRVELPDTITSISHQAFDGCTGLTGLRLPASLNQIGADAFRCCEGLTELRLPATLEAIADGMTSGCTSLERIEADPANPDFVSEEGVLYDRLGALLCYPAAKPDTTLRIGPGLRFIFTPTFIDATHITRFCVEGGSQDFADTDGVLVSKDQQTLLAYPRGRTDEGYSPHGSITTVGERAFSCSLLKRVDLPEGLRELEMGAFYNCSHLQSITVPEGVTRIGDRCFLCCSSLKEVALPHSLLKLEGGAFGSCAELESISLPGQLATVENGLFMDCASLRDVKLPPATESIGSYAFGGCAQLGHLVLPENVNSIGSRAFSGAFGELAMMNSMLEHRTMTLVMLAETPPVAAPDAFDDYTLNKVRLLVPAQSLEAYRNTPVWARFKNIAGSSDVKEGMPDEAMTFDDGLFRYAVIGADKVAATGFATSDAPDTAELPAVVEWEGAPYRVARIAESAFAETEVRYFSIDAELDEIDNYAFANSALVEIALPASLREIGIGAFGGCGNLLQANLPAGLKEIGLEAFAQCGKLQTMSIPNGVEKIAYHTFADCAKLMAVTLGNGVEAVEDGAFKNCRSLVSVAFGEKVETIGQEAFMNCELLRQALLPEGTRLVDDRAFCRCKYLCRVQLPQSLAYIGNEVFKKCRYLEAIRVTPGGDHFRSVNGALFTADMTELVLFPPCLTEGEVELPDTVLTIRDSAFEDCQATHIDVGRSVRKVGKRCFANSRIKSMKLPKTVVELGDQAFLGCRSLKDLDLPKGLGSSTDKR